ncbi:hypothetical protein B0H10DRAFT_687822 [Mycena sp. CBHHK59/15]|nr:hypothetical protein B0H10DRAFT_687822 [Mycena sp. CBHHK59/15]
MHRNFLPPCRVLPRWSAPLPSRLHVSAVLRPHLWCQPQSRLRIAVRPPSRHHSHNTPRAHLARCQALLRHRLFRPRHGHARERRPHHACNRVRPPVQEKESMVWGAPGARQGRFFITGMNIRKGMGRDFEMVDRFLTSTSLHLALDAVKATPTVLSLSKIRRLWLAHEYGRHVGFGDCPVIYLYCRRPRAPGLLGRFLTAFLPEAEVLFPRGFPVVLSGRVRCDLHGYCYYIARSKTYPSASPLEEEVVPVQGLVDAYGHRHHRHHDIFPRLLRRRSCVWGQQLEARRTAGQDG